MKESTYFSFSGHETFPFRYGWLKKGVDRVSNDPAFFSKERALIDLGVGKNMVRSIRHWCLAARLIEECSGASGNRSQLVPTRVGRSVFFDDGFDPYLEDPATLWLIHWLVASNEKMATTWHWAFSHWSSTEFTKDNLISGIRSRLENHGHKPISDDTLKRDVDCFVRVYARSQQSKSLIVEDSLDCPLVDLRLMTELSDNKTYQFQRGPQASLPDEVFVLALIEYWQSSAPSVDTMAFGNIAFAPGSPGRIFKLDEDSLTSRLERIESASGGALAYDETAGLKQVYRRPGRQVDQLKLLSSYYGNPAVKILSAN